MSALTRLLRRPSVREWPEIAVCCVLAVVVEGGLRVASLPRLARWLGVPLADDDGGAAPLRAARLGPRAERQWRALQRVSRHWPTSSTGPCLRWALVGGQRLRRLEPRLRLGVAKIDGAVRAHAWLEVGDRCLDPLGASQFLALAPVAPTEPRESA
ncbi:lasso peptide biosynthesis B2 protein [Angustibacter sp. Root456]|uniref:lasso peptide biosynthesis B2 protein n=1 Tax=Angustibacter sp. Root456 TaxID=1736539 RepID=UPI0006FAE6B6|nr:lasso peptide biosynthesis B2 protein [Angustibacter sp. Root456]KQX62901.1 hypothetical protein ASD06_12870 [Angustibacter sp. Root456]